MSCSPARGAAPAARPGLSFPGRSARDRRVAAGAGRCRGRDAPPRPLGRLASGAAASLRNPRSLRFLLPRVGGRVHRGTPVLGHGAGRPFRRSLALRGLGARQELGSVSPQVGGCGAGVPKRALVRRAVLQTRHTLSQAGSERPPSWAGEPAGAAPRAHPSASSRHPKPEWSLWSSSASCWTSWPSPCCCPCYLRCWSATAVCR